MVSTFLKEAGVDTKDPDSTQVLKEIMQEAKSKLEQKRKTVKEVDPWKTEVRGLSDDDMLTMAHIKGHTLSITKALQDKHEEAGQTPAQESTKKEPSESDEKHDAGDETVEARVGKAGEKGKAKNKEDGAKGKSSKGKGKSEAKGKDKGKGPKGYKVSGKSKSWAYPHPWPKGAWSAPWSSSASWSGDGWGAPGFY